VRRTPSPSSPPGSTNARTLLRRDPRRCRASSSSRSRRATARAPQRPQRRGLGASQSVGVADRRRSARRQRAAWARRHGDGEADRPRAGRHCRMRIVADWALARSPTPLSRDPPLSMERGERLAMLQFDDFRAMAPPWSSRCCSARRRADPAR
jgi:hypothetical protein